MSDATFDSPAASDAANHLASRRLRSVLFAIAAVLVIQSLPMVPLMIGGVIGDSELPEEYSMVLLALGYLIAIPGLFLALWHQERVSASMLSHMLALELPVNQRAFVWGALGAFIYAVLTIFVGNLLGLESEPVLSDLALLQDNALSLTAFVITAIVGAPIFEEMAFRGWFLQRVADTRLGRVGAVVLSSLLFSLVHWQYQQAFTFGTLFVGAAGLAWLRLRCFSLLPVILAHMVFNGVGVVAMYF